MASESIDVPVALRLLGSPALLADGVAIALPTRRTMALLAYVASHPDRVRRDALCELLWGDQTSARKNLRVLLSNLRRVIPDHLEIDREHVAVHDIGVDVVEFESAVAAARDEGPDAMRDAAMRYSGEFLAGLELVDAPEFELWRERERDRLRSVAAAIHEEIAIAALDDGDLDAAAEFGRRMFDIDPSDETAVRVLVEALARTGRRREAMAVFESCRSLVELELGLELLPETLALAEAVRLGRFGTARPRSAVPVLDPDGTHPSDADQPTDSRLIGRAELIRTSRRHVGDRILTFTGRGGVGKTVLAIEVVRASGRTPVVVDVVPHDDVEGVGGAALRALGLTDTTEQPWSALAEALAARNCVMVFDRAEHVAASLGRQLGQLLLDAPNVGVVVTSRSPMQAPGERVVRVPVLDAQAVELFLERAEEAGHRLGEDELPAVEAICQRLDGLPLALELAVPLLSVYSVAGLLAQLQRDDGESFGLLSLPGQSEERSLEATIARSVDLLPERTQVVFRRLSVFVDLFDIESASAVAESSEADVVRAVAQLTQLHLVDRVTDSSGDLLRMPHTIRDSARRLLQRSNESDETARRHAEHFQAIAAVARRELESPKEVYWLRRLDSQIPDLRAALAHLTSTGRRDEALAMTADLGPLWLHRGRALEGCDRLEELVAMAPDADRAWAARQWVARLRVDVRGDEVEVARSTAETLADEIARMPAADDPHDRLRALSMLGHSLNLAEDDEAARRVTGEAIAEARSASAWWLPELLHRSALLAATDGRMDDALRDAHDAYESARQMANGHMEIQSLLSLVQLPGHESLGLQLPDLAGVLELARDIGDRRSEGWIVASLGAVAILEGDVETAAAWFLDGVRSSLQTGSRQSTWFNLMGTAAVATLDGERLFAARLHGAITPRLPQLRREMPSEYVDIYESLMTDVAAAPDAVAALSAAVTSSPQSVLSEAEAFLTKRPRRDRATAGVT